MTTPAAPGDLRSYGRRHGHRLRQGMQRLVEELLPGLRIDPAAGVAPGALFAAPVDRVRLEIGFGGGEHLAALVAAHPDIGYIGCEPFVNGVAALLARLDGRAPDNLRLLDDDVRPLLDALPDASLDRVYLLFPDPWPKTRHHKRRFVQPANLDRLARVMADGAELRFASDHMGYARWALFHLCGHPAFAWTASGPDDWRRRPADWVPTRYEAKALAEGRACVYLTFRRTARAGPAAG